jgi:hypothetical protein
MKFLTRAMAGRMSIQKEKKMKRMIRMTRKMKRKTIKKMMIRRMIRRTIRRMIRRNHSIRENITTETLQREILNLESTIMSKIIFHQVMNIQEVK